MDQEQLTKWRRSVEWFRGWYLQEYKHPASGKRVESYCAANGIPWPLPRAEEENEVGPVNLDNEQIDRVPDSARYFIPLHIEMLFGGESEG